MSEELLKGTVVEQKYIIQRWYPDDDDVDGGRWEEEETPACGSWEEADKNANALLHLFPHRRFAVVKRTVVEDEVRTYRMG